MITKERWPNFFIVGAPRAGSTSLYNYLNVIPGIYMSSVKEPKFFSKKSIPENPNNVIIRDEKKYLSLFDEVKNEKIIGEVSTSYLGAPEAPELIHRQIPHAKILISLRDPVERAFSHYLLYVQYGWSTTKSFHDQIHKEMNRVRKNGLREFEIQLDFYADCVKKYLSYFGSKQVKVIIFEEFVKETKKHVQQILEFLDLDYEITNFNEEIYNAFYVPRSSLAQSIYKNKIVHTMIGILPKSTRKLLRPILLKNESKPTMNQEDRETLVEYYREDVENLKKLLDRKLPWGNFI